MSMIDIYVRDKQSGRMHRVGDDIHDMLTINDKGQLCYHNLHNGDGCRTGESGGGYEFVPNEDDYGYNCVPTSRKELSKLPSAQQEHTNSWCINSWCVNCKEYDTENKCCPRYNRVIKQTLDDAYRHGETEAEARFHTEIVRCKDCKYNSNTCGNYVNCDIIPQMFGRTADNFCSRAERRTDGSD